MTVSICIIPINPRNIDQKSTFFYSIFSNIDKIDDLVTGEDSIKPYSSTIEFIS